MALDGLRIDVAMPRGEIVEGAAIEMLDVCDPREQKICLVVNNQITPMEELQQRSGELTKVKPLVVICQHDTRSFRATLWRRRQGSENTINLAGVIDAWAHESDPRMQRY